jgi:hypothetical protein
MKTGYTLWVDAETGTWGTTDKLRLIPTEIADAIARELETSSDSDIQRIGNTLGKTIDYLVRTAFDSAYDEMENDPDNPVPALTELFEAIERVLDTFDNDGTCSICDTPFNFHTNDCPLHEVHIAMDRAREFT